MEGLAPCATSRFYKIIPDSKRTGSSPRVFHPACHAACVARIGAFGFSHVQTSATYAKLVHLAAATNLLVILPSVTI